MLTYKIENQQLIRLDTDKLIADSRNIVKGKISFDAQWNGLTVTAHFMNGNFVKSVVGVQHNTEFTVPWEVLHRGNLRIYVEGYSADTKLITAPCQPVRIYPSGIFPPIQFVRECTKNLVDQIMTKFCLTEKRVDDLYHDVEEGIFDGKLEYNWNGTSLGIRRKGETEYQYSDLKGAKGDTGAKGDSGAKGDTGAKGDSGVYVGEGDIPAGYNVQIIPNGEESELLTKPEANATYATKDIVSATTGNPGLVRVKNAYGIGLGRYNEASPTSGDTLLLIKAENNDISSRSGYGAITPKNLEFAVKSALSASTISWTQAEKDSVLTLLGIKEIIDSIGGNQ